MTDAPDPNLDQPAFEQLIVRDKAGSVVVEVDLHCVDVHLNNYGPGDTCRLTIRQAGEEIAVLRIATGDITVESTSDRGTWMLWESNQPRRDE